MEKPQLILELEKKLNCSFEVVNLEKINELRFEKTSEYSIDESSIKTK